MNKKHTNLIGMDPPGTILLKQAFLDMIKSIPQNSTFIEMGCGDGKYSKLLLEKGLVGLGIDFSHSALEKAKEKNKKFIDLRRYSLVNTDIMETGINDPADLVFSFMTMEHVENDLDFLKRMKKTTKQEGTIVVAVPGRMNKWGIEDESAGHYRRYERRGLEKLFRKAELTDIKIWSVAVPVSNILLQFSNKAVKSAVSKWESTTKEEKTKKSGIMDIPHKNLFPRYYKFILNKITMTPFCILQRIFYSGDRGIILLASAKASFSEAIKQHSS